MAIKVNVGDPKSKKTHTFEISDDDIASVHGRKIGDSIRGELIGKPGYELLITGGSDNAGFPMRFDVQGTGRRKLLITRSTGNKKTEAGIRIRKTVSGNTVSGITSQLNVKVTKHGKEPLEKPAEEASAEETPKEETKEQPKDAPPKEVKEETPKEEKPKEEAPKKETPPEKEATTEPEKKEKKKAPEKPKETSAKEEKKDEKPQESKDKPEKSKEENAKEPSKK